MPFALYKVELHCQSPCDHLHFLQTMQASAAAMPVRTGDEQTDAALLAKVGMTDAEKAEAAKEEQKAIALAHGDEDDHSEAIAAAVAGTMKTKKPIPHTTTELPEEAGKLWDTDTNPLPMGANR